MRQVCRALQCPREFHKPQYKSAASGINAFGYASRTSYILDLGAIQAASTRIGDQRHLFQGDHHDPQTCHGAVWTTCSVVLDRGCQARRWYQYIRPNVSHLFDPPYISFGHPPVGVERHISSLRTDNVFHVRSGLDLSLGTALILLDRV